MAEQQMTVILVAVVPPHLNTKMKGGKLIPQSVVFEQVGENGITAGQPEMLPVRALTPLDVIAAMNRALDQGQVTPVVAFGIPEYAPKSKLLVTPGGKV